MKPLDRGDGLGARDQLVEGQEPRAHGRGANHHPGEHRANAAAALGENRRADQEPGRNEAADAAAGERQEDPDAADERGDRPPERCVPRASVEGEPQRDRAGEREVRRQVVRVSER
ncbi:MAG TPA: hypothetical protein VGD87_05610, partial [Archangium sp.]